MESHKVFNVNEPFKKLNREIATKEFTCIFLKTMKHVNLTNEICEDS